ncbi:MAG: hypothetical protein ACFCUI_04245 [Bernardetiaceae bacterium]
MSADLFKKNIQHTLVVVGMAFFFLSGVRFVFVVAMLVVLFGLAYSKRLEPRGVRRSQTHIVILNVAGEGLLALSADGLAYLLFLLAWGVFLFRTLPALHILLKLILGGSTLFLFLVAILAIVAESEEGMTTDTTDESITTTEPIIVPDPDPKTSDSLITHTHTWRTYQSNSPNYQGIWQVRYEDFKKSERHRNKNVKLLEEWETSHQYWGHIYRQLKSHDGPALDRIVDLMQKMQAHYQLNEQQLADLVVCSVQHIPYSLIVVSPCSVYIAENPSYAGTPCVGKCRYGLHSPVEFAASFKGDCDTRTVFLFAIFERLGYKVAILNSREYAHSILGLHLPAQGSAVRYQGRNYYVWETTGKGWKIGQLPPDFGNINYWNIALLSD